MKRILLFAVPSALLLALAFSTSANAAATPPERTVFVTTLNAAEERPTCEPADRSDRGVAVIHVTDDAAGTASYLLVSTNLPGDITAAHIHEAPAGTPGPVEQPLVLNGNQHGVIGFGTFTNKELIDAMQAEPDEYYVNVHSTTCPSGVIRGQF